MDSIPIYTMPSILDQMDTYYASKRPASKVAPVWTPVNLRHPDAVEFFQNMMSRQKHYAANLNKARTMQQRDGYTQDVAASPA